MCGQMIENLGWQLVEELGDCNVYQNDEFGLIQLALYQKTAIIRLFEDGDILAEGVCAPSEIPNTPIEDFVNGLRKYAEED